jgi:hypothetical protein
VVHVCNPSYSWGQRSGGSWFEASMANSSQDPILKNLIPKKGW